MSKITIKDLKEFIERHELPDDTVINTSDGYKVFKRVEINIITRLNDKKIKNRLLISGADDTY